MSTRNERRKRARSRQRENERIQASHTGRMMARVVKGETKQIVSTTDEAFDDLYRQDRAVKPPLPLESLWEIYEQNAFHSGCIDAKVADAVGRGWDLEMEDDEVDEEDQKKKTAEVKAALRTLARPSGISGGFTALCRQLVREVDATGWGAWEVSRESADGPIDGLFPIPPHTLRAVKDSRDVYVQVKGMAKVYFKRFGAKGNYSAKDGKPTSDKSGDDVANEIIVLKQYTPRSPYYGFPQWISGVPAVAEFTAIREYNVSWFESGGTGDREIHVRAADGSVAETIADSIIETMKESKGVGHTTIVTHGTADTEVNVEHLSPETGKRDGQFGNRRHDLVQELLTAHQVPAYRIGWAIVGELGGEAASEMLDSYRYGIVEPLQEAMEELLADTIFNPELGGIDLGGYIFRFKDLDWSQLLEEIDKANALQAAGAITGNEMRVMLGQERSDDPRLDEFYTSSGSRLGGTGDTQGAESAVEVVRELTKALDVVVKGEQERLQTLAAATDTRSKDDPDPLDRSEGDDVEAADGSPEKKGKKKRPWSY